VETHKAYGVTIHAFHPCFCAVGTRQDDSSQILVTAQRQLQSCAAVR
jgi:hypothetical protein